MINAKVKKVNSNDMNEILNNKNKILYKNSNKKRKYKWDPSNILSITHEIRSTFSKYKQQYDYYDDKQIKSLILRENPIYSRFKEDFNLIFKNITSSDFDNDKMKFLIEMILLSEQYHNKKISKIEGQLQAQLVASNCLPKKTRKLIQKNFKQSKIKKNNLKKIKN
jgi:hypothetical protein